ncbi:MAG: DNA-binding protein [Thermoplasmata archaeon]|nr:MAG: DNA-binding protein [Thermoplasmata archaeon]
MPILRDKGKITEMMILLSLLRGNRKLREIADDIGITVQGVSEYMKILESEGLVKGGKPTPRGLEFLNSAVEEIGDFVHEANRIIGKIKVTEAIAGEKIREGEEVGLFMEGGYLHAYKRESSSIGVAINDAEKGEDVGVKNLRGIMDIDYGKIDVYVMPSIEEGGSRKVKREKIRELLKDNKKVGVCGVVAYVVMKDMVDIDFEFGSVYAAIDAAYRGVDTLLFVSHEMLPYALRLISEREVSYEVHSIKDL